MYTFNLKKVVIVMIIKSVKILNHFNSGKALIIEFYDKEEKEFFFESFYSICEHNHKILKYNNLKTTYLKEFFLKLENRCKNSKNVDNDDVISTIVFNNEMIEFFYVFFDLIYMLYFTQEFCLLYKVFFDKVNELYNVNKN